MEEVMGPLPRQFKNAPLNKIIKEEVDCGSYVRQLLTYQSDTGIPVTAFLLIPKKLPAGQKKFFGVLTLHQTHAAGNKVVVGLGNSTNDEYAVELVKRGFVCLAPPYPLLAGYNPELEKLGYKSGTMKAIWDNIRGLDLLAGMTNVHADKFAAIGHSLGGHNSLYTAAFEPRIKVVVTSCGFDSFRDYMGGNIKGWTSSRYMPKLLTYSASNYPFDFDDVLTALGSRPVFINAPLKDANFKWESVDKMVASAKRRIPNFKAVVEHPDCAHSFPKDLREKSYKLIESVLRE